MSPLEALALWRKLKPIWEKLEPLLEKLGLLAWLKRLGAKAIENPAPHPGRDNPDKPVTQEDILHPRDNV